MPPYPLNEKRHWYGQEAEPRSLPQPEPPAPRAPQTEADVLRDVLRIWEEATGHEDTTPDTTYAESGADSLVAIDIIAAIQKAYAVRLTALEFLTKLTPRQIATCIASGNEGGSAGCASYIRRACADDARTVFLIHPAGGSTFCYGAMNRFLTADFNICAIDLPEDYARHATLERLAAHYLELIRERQPGSPYWLGGYSFGGNVAYEIAGQMERQGMTVGSVVMFDSHPPEAYQEPDKSEIDYEPICSKVLLEFMDFGPLLSRADALDVKNFCQRWSHCFRLLKAHHPTHVVESDLVLFAGKKRERQDVMRELNMRNVDKTAWGRYFRGDVRVVPVSGDHYSMFGVTFHLRCLARDFESLFGPPATPPASLTRQGGAP